MAQQVTEGMMMNLPTVHEFDINLRSTSAVCDSPWGQFCLSCYTTAAETLLMLPFLICHFDLPCSCCLVDFVFLTLPCSCCLFCFVLLVLRFMRRCLGQLPECDAHDLTLLAVGLAVLGPTLTRGWLRKFQAAINRQPTSLDLQIQVRGASMIAVPGFSLEEVLIWVINIEKSIA
jgi:hypothetical protein